MNKRTKTRLGAAVWILLTLFGLSNCGDGGGSGNGDNTGTASYTITFDKNDAGAVGVMANQAVPGGTAVSLTACGFSKPGWTFTGWATSAVGTVAYADRAAYTMGTANLTLYAKWTANNYTITFDKNDSVVTENMAAQTIACGSTQNLSSLEFTKPGWRFMGWATSASGTPAYADAAEYTMGTADVTLYAQWGLFLRDIGPAGGWVFYDKGYYSDGWRYLEAAPVDQANSSVWGTEGVSVPGTDTAIGSGKRNTALILAYDSANKAADRCALYSTVNAYDDWFLPSSDELNEMYVNLKTQGVGGFADTNYWSSSEYNTNNARGQNFNISLFGYRWVDFKSLTFHVRAVRAF
jgi:uncharacterized repeat protein (TIGR02543 family)